MISIKEHDAKFDIGDREPTALTMTFIYFPDTQIAQYYRPDLRCVRTWMPHLVFCLNEIVTQSHIVVKHLGGEQIHKDFQLQWIDAWLTRARFEEGFAGRKRKQRGPNEDGVGRDKPKRSKYVRMSTADELSEIRLNTNLPHTLERGGTQRHCRMCAFLRGQLKRQDPNARLPKIVRTTKSCRACDAPLCDDHFDLWHKQGQ